MQLGRIVSATLVFAFSASVSSPVHASNWASALRFEDRVADEVAPSEDEDAAEARAAYKAGTREYALGNYEVAVSHFERSFELSQRPELLFNIAQSYARWYEISNDIGHLRKAERLFKNYVSYLDTDDHPDPAARADAEAAIADVERLLASHESDPANETDRDDRPVHKKAWFWVAIIGGAAAVGGAIAAGVILSRPPPEDPELGRIGGRVGGRVGPSAGGIGFSF